MKSRRASSKKDSEASSKPPNQGELLKKLYEWSGKKTQQDFARQFDSSRYWYLKAITWEIVPTKDKYDICRAYNIPMEYFEGKYELPLKPETTVSEPAAEYGSKYGELQKKYIAQTEELLNAYRKIDLLNDEIKELSKKKQTPLTPSTVSMLANTAPTALSQ
jgi:hypothetical protein